MKYCFRESFIHVDIMHVFYNHSERINWQPLLHFLQHQCEVGEKQDVPRISHNPKARKVWEASFVNGAPNCECALGDYQTWCCLYMTASNHITYAVTPQVINIHPQTTTQRQGYCEMGGIYETLADQLGLFN